MPKTWGIIVLMRLDFLSVEFAATLATLPDDAAFKAARLLNTRQITSISETTPLELAAKKAAKDAVDRSLLRMMSAEEIALASGIVVTYLKRLGENVGDLFPAAPKVGAFTLADTLKKGQEIEVTPTRVRAGSKEFKFEVGKSWNPLDHTGALAAVLRTAPVCVG
jgi:hypothetical protein